jgi:hypothetical protein
MTSLLEFLLKEEELENNIHNGCGLARKIAEINTIITIIIITTVMI